MTANISAKAIAIAGISVLTAGGITVVNTVSQGYLFEIKKATAATQAALAEMEKAKAAALDATNKLKGTENAAAAEIAAAKEVARSNMIAAEHVERGAIIAAQNTAGGLVDATKVAVHADNEAFDEMTNPLIATPVKKMTELNDQIVRLNREISSGIDRKTRRLLTDSELADRAAQKAILEEDLSTLKESTSKNLSDTVSLAFGMIGQLMGNAGGLAPDAQRTPATPTWLAR